MVRSKKELQLIIAHFDKFPLVTCKFSDYLLFKQYFEILTKQRHLTKNDFLKILGLKNGLNLGLSDKLKEAFPNTIPINRPQYVFKGIPDNSWVAGFTSGDGSFYLKVLQQKSKFTENVSNIVRLNFKICLNIREEEVLKGLFNFFKLHQDKIFDLLTEDQKTKLEIKSPPIYTSFKESTVSLHISKFSDIINIIIPFFEQYPIIGQKNLDFLDFKIVSELVKTKSHLTSEGFKKIEEINSQMNQRRPWS